jgi:hypothetical protein
MTKGKKTKGNKTKNTYYQVDTSRYRKTPTYSNATNINVEKDIKKDKEVKEKDVFEFNQKK